MTRREVSILLPMAIVNEIYGARCFLWQGAPQRLMHFLGMWSRRKKNKLLAKKRKVLSEATTSSGVTAFLLFSKWYERLCARAGLCGMHLNS